MHLNLLISIMPYIASLFLGIASSFFAWWFLQHRLTPQASFSQELAKYKVPGGGTIYLSAFRNAGHRRMIDVEVIAQFGIKEYNGAEGWAYFSVRTNASRLPELEKNRRGIVRILDDREEIFYLDAPSKGLRNAVGRIGNLEKILDLGTDSSIMVHVFCTDEFSGTRRHIKSQEYNKHSIRNGRFRGLNVVGANHLNRRIHSRSAL